MHVVTRALTPDSLLVSPDLGTAVEVARATGAILLASRTPQETHDVALLAHAIARASSWPVMHAIDASAGGDESSVRLLRNGELNALVTPRAKINSNNNNNNSTLLPPPTVTDVSAIFSLAASAIGHAYAPFSYAGSETPDVVLVAAGASAAVAQQVARALADRGEHVGVVSLLLLAPLAPGSLAGAIPGSPRAIGVLSLGAAPGGYFATTVGAALGNGNGKQLIDVYDTHNGGSFTSRHAEAALRSLLKGGVSPMALPRGAAVPLALVGGSSSSSSTLTRIAVWGVGADADGADTLARNLVRTIVAGAGGNDVSASTTHAATRFGVVARTLIQVGSCSDAPELDDSQDSVVLSHSALLSDYAALAPLRTGGSLIIALAAPVERDGADDASPSSVAAAALVDALPPAALAALAARRVRVVAIDAAAIATAAGLSGHAELALQSAFFVARGAATSARASPLLEAEQRATLGAAGMAPAPAAAALARLYARVRFAASPFVPTAVDVSAASLPVATDDTLLVSSFFPRTVRAPLPIGCGPSDWELRGGTARKERPPTRSSAALALAFPTAFAAKTVLRPLDSGVFSARVSVNRRLTPLDYDRNVFHLELDTTGTGLTYAIGAALGVHGLNDAVKVDALLSALHLDPISTLALEAPGGKSAHMTAFSFFRSEADVFGACTREFYEALAAHAVDVNERAALLKLGSDKGTEAFALRATEACTFADALLDFPSARPSLAALGEMLPRIKPRHYSIASSQRATPTSVHLLVVEVAWTTPKGRVCSGQCSSYLAALVVGESVAVSVLTSEMHLPADPMAPVVMAGLGTGMAPFRAFIQERAALRDAGTPVGPMTLYFGSRYRAKEYLYGEELDAYAASGLVTLRLAFSRDAESKCYIQHLMGKDGVALADALDDANKGAFYLCGPTWPEPDVEAAIVGAFTQYRGLSSSEAAARITSLKAARRYVLEVY